MRKHLFSKLFSLVLTVAMTVTMSVGIPMTASAASSPVCQITRDTADGPVTTQYAAVHDALASITDSTPVTIDMLMDDTDIYIENITGRDITFALNGHSVAFNQNQEDIYGAGLGLTNCKFGYTGSGQLTAAAADAGTALGVTDSTVTMTGVTSVNGYGISASGSQTNITINGDVAGTRSPAIESQGTPVIAAFDGSVTVNGNVTQTNGEGVDVFEGAIVTINGDIVANAYQPYHDSGFSYDDIANTVRPGGFLTVNGNVKIGGLANMGVYTYYGGNITINGSLTVTPDSATNAYGSSTFYGIKAVSDSDNPTNIITVTGDVAGAGPYATSVVPVYSEMSTVNVAGALAGDPLEEADAVSGGIVTAGSVPAGAQGAFFYNRYQLSLIVVLDPANTAHILPGYLAGYTTYVDFLANSHGYIAIKSTTPGPAAIPVTGITGVPATVTAGTPLALTGTVAPTDATNQAITWSVKDAGTTSATINGNTLNTNGAGTAVIRATITDGTASGTDYTQDFTITVDPIPAPTVAQSITYGGTIAPQTPATVATVADPDLDPWGMTFDAAGNLYICDYGSGIYKLVPGGSTAVLWNTDVHDAIDICYANGYLYAIDNTALYQISTITGVDTVLYNSFNNTFGIAVDSNGSIWVADNTDNGDLVNQMQPGGRSVQITYPVHVAGMLAFSPDYDLYISSQEVDSSVYRLDPASGNTSLSDITGMSQPYAIRFDTAGNLYIADYGNDQVVKVLAGTTTPLILGSVPGTTGLAFDAAGNLYTCSNNGNIVKFAASNGDTLSIYTIPTTSSSVFGTAGADAYVKVTAGNQTVIVQADANGNWDATAALGALTQGQPVTAQVVGNNTGTTTVSGTVQTYVVAPPAGANYALTMQAGTGGTITAGASGSYAQGQVINITANPNNNYKFSNWTSSNGGTFANANSATTTFTMPGDDTTVTANFSLISGGSGGGSGGSVASYTVTYNTNGGSAVHSQSVANGSKLSQPAAPVKDGYTFNGWYTDAALTKAFDFSKTVSGNMTLYAAWTASTTVNPTTNPSTTSTPTTPTVAPSAAGWQNPFADVKATDWFYGDVQYVSNNNLFNGTSATAFAPNSPMTRAMFVTVLWRAAGSPSVSGSSQFKDVPASAYYATAVNWAAQNKVVLGISSSLFAPDQQVTREQMAAILYRYEQFSGQIPSNTVTAKQFADANKIGDYAKASVNALVSQGILSGKPGNLFDPQGVATRAQVAAMVHRFMQSVQ